MIGGYIGGRWMKYVWPFSPEIGSSSITIDSTTMKQFIGAGLTIKHTLAFSIQKFHNMWQ